VPESKFITPSRAVIANSGDTFKGVYSDGTRPKIEANGASMAFNVGDTKGVTISGLSISGTKGGEWCEPECGGAIKKDGRNLHVINVRLHHNPNQGIGNPGPGFLLKNSEIDHNGSASFTKTLSENRQIEQDVGAGKLNEGQPVFGLLRPASAQAATLGEPGNRPLHHPSPRRMRLPMRVLLL
jgi:hypothetical protein